VQVVLVVRSAAEEQQRNVCHRRPRRRADSDRVVHLTRANEGDDLLDEDSRVGARPDDDGVESLDDHRDADCPGRQNVVHDRSTACIPLGRRLHDVGSGSQVGFGPT
jgi:hypothetical protein